MGCAAGSVQAPPLRLRGLHTRSIHRFQLSRNRQVLELTGRSPNSATAAGHRPAPAEENVIGQALINAPGSRYH